MENDFDLIAISGEKDFPSKPNPEVVRLIRSNFPDIKDYEICMIGD